MLGTTPNGEPPGRAALRVAGLDAGRQALLVEMLAGLARAQEPEAVWTELAGRLKWLLDFERCDVAVINPDGQTYHLQTVFEARPGIPRVREAHVPLAAGVLGVLLQRGTPDAPPRAAQRSRGAAHAGGPLVGGGLAGLRLRGALARRRGRPWGGSMSGGRGRGAMRRRTWRLCGRSRPS